MTTTSPFQLAVLVLAAQISDCYAAEYLNGTVVRVSDGDTLHVETDSSIEKLRLYAIDCPEMSQPHGPAARGFARSVVLHHEITALIHDTDRYGRLVCEVFIDGTSLNRRLVTKGHAWWYPRYAADDHDIKRLQEKARASGLGLWAHASPIEPWRWRRGVRPSRVEDSIALAPRAAEHPPLVAEEVAEAEIGTLEAGPDTPLLGSVVAADRTGSELRAFLRHQYTPSDTLSYRNARQAMFSTIDNHDGKVELVYSGAWFETTGIPNHRIVNTEHCWPRSRFSDREVGQHGLRMQSDIHHLFPTYSKINNERGNKPFVEIPDHETVTWWVSPLPSVHPPEPSIRDEFSESIPSGFEPPEAHKGNVARAIFYCAVIYAERANDWTWYESQVPTLRRWHQLDPADEAEFERTLQIGNLQGNFNPFVVDPTLVERIHVDE